MKIIIFFEKTVDKRIGLWYYINMEFGIYDIEGLKKGG